MWVGQCRYPRHKQLLVATSDENSRLLNQTLGTSRGMLLPSHKKNDKGTQEEKDKKKEKKKQERERGMNDMICTHVFSLMQ
jgi:hypothetical protein